jgi:hypothetical protein
VGALAGARAAIVGGGLLLIIAGFIYAQSASFNADCGVRKVTGVSIGIVKNLVCDADFTIKD